MNEVSSIVFIKKYKFVLTGKKIDFDLSKYQICFVVLKKSGFDDKNSDMFCYI